MAIRRGTRDDDDLLGTQRNDLLKGQRGDDRLTGGLGNDLIEGDAGFDTAVLRGSVLDSTVSIRGPVAWVNGPDGFDALTGRRSHRVRRLHAPNRRRQQRPLRSGRCGLDR